MVFYCRFGINRLPDAPIRTFLSLVIAGLSDKTLIMLSVAAFVSLLLGINENPKTGWIEGTAIMVAVMVVVLVSATNDYQKARHWLPPNLFC